MKRLILVVLAVMLTACQATQKQITLSPHQYLNDEAFPAYVLFPVETEEQVFALDDEAKAFVDDVINPVHDPTDQMETLVRSIFDRSEFNLLYMGSANTIASETFHNRAANCLSLSIMTYALAKHAGFGAQFQDIEIPEYWTRREGFSMLNGHINLKLVPRPQANVVHLLGHGLEVDFDPQATRRHFPKRYVKRRTVLAMFYNNKGADALVSNSYSKAYSYFRAAIETAPLFDSAWVNLGFLYRLNGHYELAENSYKQALALDEDNLTAWENLSFLYDYTERPEMAEQIRYRVEKQRIDNPFYHFILGEQALEENDLKTALGHYRDALRLDKSKHEIYFGLGKTYYQMGDMTRSALYFRKAKSRARSGQDQERYQGKLDLLTRRVATER